MASYSRPTASPSREAPKVTMTRHNYCDACYCEELDEARNELDAALARVKALEEERSKNEGRIAELTMALSEVMRHGLDAEAMKLARVTLARWKAPGGST